MRIATWRLEATGRADPALLLRAARLARYDHDFRQAANLARAALAAEPSAAAGLVLGESLYNLGSFEEAEPVLADATERATGDDEVVRVATVRRRNLFRGCRRDADAVAVGERRCARGVYRGRRRRAARRRGGGAGDLRAARSTRWRWRRRSTPRRRACACSRRSLAPSRWR